MPHLSDAETSFDSRGVESLSLWGGLLEFRVKGRQRGSGMQTGTGGERSGRLQDRVEDEDARRNVGGEVAVTEEARVSFRI